MCCFYPIPHVRIGLLVLEDNLISGEHESLHPLLLMYLVGSIPAQATILIVNAMHCS